MPELPEVETIVRRLQTVLPGKTIASVAVRHPKSFVGAHEQLAGAEITGISRRAKIARIHLSTGAEILVHLKMTGQLIYQDGQTRLGGGHPTADWTNQLPSKHTRVVLELSDSATLFFNDMRIFGWMKLLDAAGVQAELAAYAPDIIDPAITPAYLAEKFARRRVAIKQVVMDNAVVAGVGNIYANDALFLAGLHPARPADSLTLEEIKTLYQALVQVIEAGVVAGGATIDTYFQVDGFSGKYQEMVKVYKQEGKPCLVCGTLIERIKQGGRSSFLCPHCQPLLA
ncbi:MAG: bifunctional DNA-formamidopyrimidine glycosylase/DNA-(apurinic or apyrimidinic site) lyase [Patescibacteria group bacterium]